jgi:RHS repeat-associated protein
MTNTVTAVNTFGANGLLSRNTGPTSATSVYYTFDPQGNTCQRLDSSGNVLSSHFFDAYGAEYDQPSGTKAGPFGYGGQWGYYTDSETNLVLLTNRYYDPARGRFLTRDPAGYGGGINLYGYVGNSPLSGTDPLGLCSGDDDENSGIPEALAGFHAFWGGVHQVGRGLQTGIEFAAAFNPVTSVGIGINKLGEGNYGQAALFLLPAVGALGGEGAAAEGAARSTLYHCTTEEGLQGILESGELNASVGGPAVATHGPGQYLTNVSPDAGLSLYQISRRIYLMPWKNASVTHYLEVDVSGLQVEQHAPYIFRVPGEGPLDLTGRIVRSGATPGKAP